MASSCFFVFTFASCFRFCEKKLSGEEDSRLNDLLWLLGRFPYPEDMGRRHRILSFLSTYFPSPVPPLDSIYVIQLLNQYPLYLKEFLKSDTCLLGQYNNMSLFRTKTCVQDLNSHWSILVV